MSVVVVLGAGATKACGGPLTADILHGALTSPGAISTPESADLAGQFLADTFGLRSDLLADRTRYPGLPLVLSLLDTALVRRDAFGPAWPEARVRAVRAAIEDTIYGLVESETEHAADLHGRLFRTLDLAAVISLNYDLLADHALTITGEPPVFPDYGCDVGTPAYGNAAKGVPLYKLHGSLNWLYCSACHYLALAATGTGPNPDGLLAVNAERRCPGKRGASACGTALGRVLITPSHMKDYRNPHIASVWMKAEQALRQAEKVVFIGYSLPWDDVEVIYLLRRALLRKSFSATSEITVVEYAREGPDTPIEEHDAGRRFRAVFGEVDWQPLGFEDWLGTLEQGGADG